MKAIFSNCAGEITKKLEKERKNNVLNWLKAK